MSRLIRTKIMMNNLTIVKRVIYSPHLHSILKINRSIYLWVKLFATTALKSVPQISTTICVRNPFAAYLL